MRVAVFLFALTFALHVVPKANAQTQQSIILDACDLFQSALNNQTKREACAAEFGRLNSAATPRLVPGGPSPLPGGGRRGTQVPPELLSELGNFTPAELNALTQALAAMHEKDTHVTLSDALAASAQTMAQVSAN